MHPILSRQLRRSGLNPKSAPDTQQWTAFLTALDLSYIASDEDRRLVEQSLILSSREMHELHEALRQQRDNLRRIIDSLDEGVMVFDANYKSIEANPEALRLTRMTHEMFMALDMQETSNTPGLDPRVSATMKSFLNYELERPGYTRIDDVNLMLETDEIVTVSFGFIPVLVENNLDTIIVVMRDLSELRKYEVELQHAQKLEAVGRLASGIAHEINTPVQFVSDNIRFFTDAFHAFGQAFDAADVLYAVAEAAKLDEGSLKAYRQVIDDVDIDFFRSELGAATQQSVDGMERVATIVRAMKTFAHPGSGERSPSDLNNAVRSTLAVAGNEIKYVAVVREDLADLPLVPCYLGDINQVLLNLLVNAAHSIAERNEGTQLRGEITVRTYRDIDFVVIEISDTGTGISESARSRLFEPFFTTKDVGKGTGQGLALARSIIVDSHGGTLTFDTTLGVGTTFRIKLPLSA